MLPNGGLLIDTPGIRELQLWGDEDDLSENFNDITTLARRCKFTTCSHTSEPGCAVQEALRAHILSVDHYANYLKMKGELGGLKAKRNALARHNNKRSAKAIANQTKDALREMREDI